MLQFALSGVAQRGTDVAGRTSSGFATYPHDAKAPHDSIRQVDEMMYMVKEQHLGQRWDRAKRSGEVMGAKLPRVE